MKQGLGIQHLINVFHISKLQGLGYGSVLVVVVSMLMRFSSNWFMAWKGLLIEVLGDRELRVLDVGTGTGFIALLLAELGHEVIGVDISEEMLRIAREKARKLNIENVEFHLADAEELPFPDNTFDAVVARHVIWALPNPEKAYSEWKRVLRPGER